MQDKVGAFARDVTRAGQEKGAGQGMLAGVRFGAKDLFDVAGEVTGYGNPDWARSHPPASETARAITLLLDAGASLVGKTHTDELAYSLMGINAHYGTPVNSADPRRVPGGSSSGSAAAVAADLVELGLGSDTGGSVRIPASFCGLWGIRTSFGAVSLAGAAPFTRSFDTVGWFAKTGALMARTARSYGFLKTAPPSRLLLPVDLWAAATPEVVAAMAPALAQLQAHMGPATPVVMAREGLAHWRETFRVCQAAEIWSCLGPWITAHAPRFGPGTKERFEMASKIDAAHFAQAEADKAAIVARIQEVVGPETVLAYPTAPGPAPFLDAGAEVLDDVRRRAFEMLCTAGFAGLPQLSVPAGRVDDGPVGLSLTGAKGQDLALIELAIAAGLAAGQDAGLCASQ